MIVQLHEYIIILLKWTLDYSYVISTWALTSPSHPLSTTVLFIMPGEFEIDLLKVCLDC